MTDNVVEFPGKEGEEQESEYVLTCEECGEYEFLLCVDGPILCSTCHHPAKEETGIVFVPVFLDD